ncbi:MAG: hypothetical protein AAF462_07640 [Thermodesulfobacteriota bacterium]
MCENQQKYDELARLEQKFEEILAADPASNTFSQLADVLCKQGKIDKAIGVLVRGLVHNKNNVTARFMLGEIYYDRWLIDQAKREMEIVLEITPDKLEAAKLLSEIYKSEGRLDKAKTTLEQAYVFHSEDNSLLSEIESINTKLTEKQSRESKTAFETPIESRRINEINANVSTLEAEVYTETMFNLYLQQGEYEKAREIIDKVYSDDAQRNSAIEKLEKTKLNKMNSFAGFNSQG